MGTGGGAHWVLGGRCAVATVECCRAGISSRNTPSLAARPGQAFRVDHILGFFRIWEIPGMYQSGVMGHFRPSIPFTKAELEQKGIWDFDRCAGLPDHGAANRTRCRQARQRPPCPAVGRVRGQPSLGDPGHLCAMTIPPPLWHHRLCDPYVTLDLLSAELGESLAEEVAETFFQPSYEPRLAYLPPYSQCVALRRGHAGTCFPAHAAQPFRFPLFKGTHA